MEMILENLSNQNSVANRLQALKNLAKLLLYEVESLAEVSPSKSDQTVDFAIVLNAEVQRYEINLICNALVSAKGNQRRAASLLGMKTTTLHAKLKRYEIDTFNLSGQFTSDKIKEI
jgi:DNA-binding NtrC family response regulator